MVKQIYERLLASKRPKDFFGEIKSEDELKKVYRSYAKKVHPDVVGPANEYIASQSIAILTKMYKQAITEFENGIYNVFDEVKLYESASPMFEITINDKLYKFYENVFEGEVAYIYKGISDGEIVYLKVAIDASDNPLIDTEYDVLSKLRHQSLPYVEKKIMVNDSKAILMRQVQGMPMTEVINEHKRGVPANHVMWMLERILSVVGYLHSNLVVHGNIKPENLIVNKDNHNVSLLGFSLCITNANTEGAKYKIVNDYYTAPEVDSNMEVLPSSDIYSIGKIAIELLGGDIQSNGMPVAVDARVRDFIRKMVAKNPSDRPNDAWKLWSELSKLRTEVFGKARFEKFE